MSETVHILLAITCTKLSL